MKTAVILFSLIFFSLTAAPVAGAKTFKNSYLSFELPDSWACEQEQTEYVCTPLDASEARNAMIILAAKEAGPEDNFSAYQNYLAKPRLLKTTKGVPEPSKVIHSKARVINSQQWIEGLHLSSEIEGFYTLYLATVKQGLAVLVSLSAEKNKATQYNKDFAAAVKSIRLTASNELLSAIHDRKNLQKQTPVGIPSEVQIPADPEASPKALTSSVSKEMLWGGLVALLLIIVYFGISTFFPKKKKRR